MIFNFVLGMELISPHFVERLSLLFGFLKRGALVGPFHFLCMHTILDGHRNYRRLFTLWITRRLSAVCVCDAVVKPFFSSAWKLGFDYDYLLTVKK